MAAEPTIVRHPERERYDLVLGDEVIGELDYVDRGDVRAMHHTGVRSAHGGKGYAALLVRRALDDARAEAKRVNPLCWYVAGYIDRHPDDADLLA